MIKLSPRPVRLKSSRKLIRNLSVDLESYGKFWRPIPFGVIFHVTDKATLGSKAGKLAKQLLFTDYPNFIIRVGFSVARPTKTLISNYAHHKHPLFNAFFGIYEVDMPLSANHAFAFDSHGQPIVEDCVKMAAADWGLFSALIYGAPKAAIVNQLVKPLRVDGLKLSEVTSIKSAQHWYTIEFQTIVPSPLTGLGQQPTHRTLLLPFWRLAFGRLPKSASNIDNTPITVIGFLRQEKHKKFFRTIIVGGAVKTATLTNHPEIARRIRQACDNVIEY